MCVEGGFFFKINKRDSTFIREMRVHALLKNTRKNYQYQFSTDMMGNDAKLQENSNMTQGQQKV